MRRIEGELPRAMIGGELPSTVIFAGPDAGKTSRLVRHDASSGTRQEHAMLGSVSADKISCDLSGDVHGSAISLFAQQLGPGLKPAFRRGVRNFVVYAKLPQATGALRNGICIRLNPRRRREGARRHRNGPTCAAHVA